jgi:CheY-like chemotaxis protein
MSLDGQCGPALDTGRLSGRRVLLAEDNLINQTVARKMLHSLGMQVEVAANGLEALHAVAGSSVAGGASGPDATADHQQQFSIVLMDMAMPVMGGVEATRAIRAAGFTLPIVASECSGGGGGDGRGHGLCRLAAPLDSA